MLLSSPPSGGLILVIAGRLDSPSLAPIHPHWVGFAIPGFVLPRLGWIHGCWPPLTVVGHSLRSTLLRRALLTGGRDDLARASCYIGLGWLEGVSGWGGTREEKTKTNWHDGGRGSFSSCTGWASHFLGSPCVNSALLITIVNLCPCCCLEPLPISSSLLVNSQTKPLGPIEAASIPTLWRCYHQPLLPIAFVDSFPLSAGLALKSVVFAMGRKAQARADLGRT